MDKKDIAELITGLTEINRKELVENIIKKTIDNLSILCDLYFSGEADGEGRLQKYISIDIGQTHRENEKKVYLDCATIFNPDGTKKIICGSRSMREVPDVGGEGN